MKFVSALIRPLSVAKVMLALAGGSFAWLAVTGTCPMCGVGSALCGFVSTAQGAMQPAGNAAERGRPTPPAIKATTLDGKPIALSDFAGKVVLIDFWATWCGPCVAELPHVKSAYTKFHDQGFEIIGISLDDNKDALKKFIAKREMPWAQIVNNEIKGGKDPASVYGVSSIPTTVLVGRDGTIAATNLRGERLGKEVEKALKAPAPAAKAQENAVNPGANAEPLAIDIGRERGPERPGLGVLDAPAPAWEVDTWFNLPAGKGTLDIADYKGKVVYLYGFQSWCPGCHSQGFPTMQKLISKFDKADDVAFVAVQTTFEGYDTNTAAKAKATGERYNLSIPIGHSGAEGKRSALMRSYKTGGTPWTIIIDKDGVVRYNDFHITPEQGEKLIGALRARASTGTPK